jgi:pilus assembly protein Flp/PilA
MQAARGTGLANYLRLADATTIEYGLIAAGISLAIIAIVNGLGAKLNTKFTAVNSSLSLARFVLVVQDAQYRFQCGDDALLRCNRSRSDVVPVAIRNAFPNPHVAYLQRGKVRLESCQIPLRREAGKTPSTVWRRCRA